MVFFVQNNIDINSYIDYLEKITDSKIYIDSKFKNREFTKLHNELNSNYIWVRGENLYVINLLKNLLIDEKNLILITCTAKNVLKRIYKPFYKNKNVFLPRFSYDGDYLLKISGEKHYLTFDPCQSEVNMLRNANAKNFKEYLLYNFERFKYSSFIDK